MRRIQCNFVVKADYHENLTYYPLINQWARGITQIIPTSRNTRNYFGARICVPINKMKEALGKSFFYLDISNIKNFGPEIQPAFKDLVGRLTKEISLNKRIISRRESFFIKPRTYKRGYEPRIGRIGGASWRTSNGLPKGD